MKKGSSYALWYIIGFALTAIAVGYLARGDIWSALLALFAGVMSICYGVVRYESSPEA